MHKARASFFVCAGLLGLALLLPRLAAAAWPTDPLVNVPLCTATSYQLCPALISDGAGGAIVTWYDYRSGNSDIYAQRVSADGTVQWPPDGVAICTASGSQYLQEIVSDGAGGAIITWEDQRSGNWDWDIYAQRISATGVVQWTTDGVALCAATMDQQYPLIVSDGAGGAIIAWWDARPGNLAWDIYAQRIAADGTPLWTHDGVALCAATGQQTHPTIVSDGASGAIVAWVDRRAGSGFDTDDIYTQRISAEGAIQWTADGVALCTAAGSESSPTIASDGAGGAIVTWQDHRNGTTNHNYDIYAQRISAGGAVQWTPNGAFLCATASNQPHPKAALDDAGGAIIAWGDVRGGNYDLYAQRISPDGTAQWTAGGVAVGTTTGTQYTFHEIVPDGVGGAMVTWPDSCSGGYDIYAQRVSAVGSCEWPAGGVAISTAIGDQKYPAIASDGAGGAIVAWHDNRSNYDIYAQRVCASGQLGGGAGSVLGEGPLAFSLDPVRPNPTRGGALTVQFTLPSAAPARLELLDVAGRRIAAREVGPLGAGHQMLDLDEGRRLAPGLYLVCLRQGMNVRVTRVLVLK